MKVLAIQIDEVNSLIDTLPVLKGLMRTVSQNFTNEESKPSLELTCLVDDSQFDGVNSIASSWQEKPKFVSFPRSFFLDFILKRKESTDCEGKFYFDRIEEWLNKNELFGYDKVVNFSFSATSSFLSYLIDPKAAGYNRLDSFLMAPNSEMSKYHMAQVSDDGGSRFYISDVLAQFLDFELCKEDYDFLGKDLIERKNETEKARPSLAVIIDDSYLNLNRDKLKAVLLSLVKSEKIGVKVFFSRKLKGLKLEVEDFLPSSDDLSISLFPNEISELIRIFRDADVVWGGLRGGFLLAEALGKIGLVFSPVEKNFYQYSPRSPRSFLLNFSHVDEISSEMISREILQIALGEIDRLGFSRVEISHNYPYYRRPMLKKGALDSHLVSRDYEWALIGSIYQGLPWPKVIGEVQEEALTRLFEINEIAIYQLENAGGQISRELTSILERSDQILSTIVDLEPSLRPLVNWFFVEKITIGPGSKSDFIDKTLNLHVMMKSLLVELLGQQDLTESLGGAVNEDL